MKKTIVFILAIVLAVGILATGALAATWTSRQEKAHELADGARELGYGDDSPAVVVMQDIWWLEHGSDFEGSYYYSARTGRYYTLTPSEGRGADGSYFDGEYQWYLDEESGYYYRYDRNGRCVWGERARYYEEYKEHKLWFGLVTDVDKYVDSSEAEQIARFILSYTDGTESTRFKAELAWCLLNCKGGGTMKKALDKFEDYNSKLKLDTDRGKEALAIAKDVLFRLAAENSGVVASGRVLPKDYSWMWEYDGGIYFRQSRNGENWDHSSDSPY